MLRALAAAALALALFAVDAPRDAGEGLDGGVTDGGASDGGVVDAGPPPPKSSWQYVEDGGFLDEDAGISDRVVAPVGGSQSVRFPHPVIFGHCDDQSLFRIDGTEDTLIFRGLKPGRTHCGFWFVRQPFPNRFVEVTVPGHEAPVDAGKPVPFWAR